MLAGTTPARAEVHQPLTPVADPMVPITAAGITVRLTPFVTIPAGRP